jgi:hypothetical protein
MTDEITNRQLALKCATEYACARIKCSHSAINVVELANHMYHFLENIQYNPSKNEQ